jgi:hypothetical protein
LGFGFGVGVLGVWLREPNPKPLSQLRNHNRPFAQWIRRNDRDAATATLWASARPSSARAALASSRATSLPAYMHATPGHSSQSHIATSPSECVSRNQLQVGGRRSVLSVSPRTTSVQSLLCTVWGAGFSRLQTHMAASLADGVWGAQMRFALNPLNKTNYCFFPRGPHLRWRSLSQGSQWGRSACAKARALRSAPAPRSAMRIPGAIQSFTLTACLRRVDALGCRVSHSGFEAQGSREMVNCKRMSASLSTCIGIQS